MRHRVTLRNLALPLACGAQAAVRRIVAQPKAQGDASPFAPQPHASDFVSIAPGGVSSAGTGASATAMPDVSLASDRARSP